MRRISLLTAVLFLSACDGGPADPDAGPDPDAATGACAADVDCDDGLFCNGAERCDPGSRGGFVLRLVT